MFVIHVDQSSHNLQVNAFGTYNSYYKETILPSQSILLLNLVGSMNAFIILLMSAPVGRFLDAGYTRSLLITGAILTAIGCFLLSVVNGDGGHASGHYGGIWATQGLTMGLGMASFFVSASQGSTFAFFYTDYCAN